VWVIREFKKIWSVSGTIQKKNEVFGEMSIENWYNESDRGNLKK
jgi:hypothetical protein